MFGLQPQPTNEWAEFSLNQSELEFRLVVLFERLHFQFYKNPQTFGE
jgi:hypothetical protein